MDDYHYSSQDNWEYGTGRTDPPKSRTGLMAVLLILVIFLTGIVTVLGVLNIRLFRQLSAREEEAELSISFTQEESAPEAVPETTVPAVSGSEFRLDLQRSPQAIENIPQEGGLSLQEIYSRCAPSVISITTDSASGTGVILSRDGYLVTNAHVVEGAGTISVRLSDDREFTARVVGRDAVSDLAVLSIDAADLTPAQFGDSDNLRVGDAVVAIGDPLGSELRGTMTNGIISAINRDVTVDGRSMSLIQTNAALNSGNSGGPLINQYGQVVGINTIKMMSEFSNIEGLGFAIPTQAIRRVVNQLLTDGEIPPEPLLGITVEQMGTLLPDGTVGARIDSVSEGGAGDRAGLQADDIIVSAGGKDVRGSGDVLRVRKSYRVGDQLPMTVYRDGEYLDVVLDLQEAAG